MVRSQLPILTSGDEVGGCVFMEEVKGDENGVGGTTFWRLRCICGYEFTRRASEHWYYAKQGKKKLCKNKHLHTDVAVGSRFGRLEVTSFAKIQILTSKSEEKRGFAVCNCSCGKTGINVLPEQLRSGEVKSCGCYLKESTGDRFRTHGKTDTREFDLWAAAKERANKSGIPFNIELSDILIPDICPVLGIRIDKNLGRGRRQPDSPSLDKFVPERGYVKGNIQVVSWRANWLKNNGTVEEWIKIAKWCQQEEVKGLLEAADKDKDNR